MQTLFLKSFGDEIQKFGFRSRTLILPAWDAGPENLAFVKHAIEGTGKHLRGIVFEISSANNISETVKFFESICCLCPKVVWKDGSSFCERADLSRASGSGLRNFFWCTRDEKGATGLAISALNQLGHSRIGIVRYRQEINYWWDLRIKHLRRAAANMPCKTDLFVCEDDISYWSLELAKSAEEMLALLKSDAQKNEQCTVGTGGEIHRNTFKKFLLTNAPALKELLFEKKITALIAPHDWIAYKYLPWLAEIDISVPHDLSIISFDNLFRSAMNHISSIDFRFEQMGYLLAHLFIEDIPLQTKTGEIAPQPFLADWGSLALPRHRN